MPEEMKENIYSVRSGDGISVNDLKPERNHGKD